MMESSLELAEELEVPLEDAAGPNQAAPPRLPQVAGAPGMGSAG